MSLLNPTQINENSVSIKLPAKREFGGQALWCQEEAKTIRSIRSVGMREILFGPSYMWAMRGTLCKTRFQELYYNDIQDTISHTLYFYLYSIYPKEQSRRRSF
jgi:hypothetical protein